MVFSPRMNPVSTPCTGAGTASLARAFESTFPVQLRRSELDGVSFLGG